MTSRVATSFAREIRYDVFENENLQNAAFLRKGGASNEKWITKGHTAPSQDILAPEHSRKTYMAKTTGSSGPLSLQIL